MWQFDCKRGGLGTRPLVNVVEVTSGKQGSHVFYGKFLGWVCVPARWRLQSLVDQPIVVSHDTTVGRKFLLCDYSRDGDSFR